MQSLFVHVQNSDTADSCVQSCETSNFHLFDVVINRYAYWRAFPSFQSVEKLVTVKCGWSVALIQANISFLGGTLLCEPIWYLRINNQIIPRISFVLPPTTSSGPEKDEMVSD